MPPPRANHDNSRLVTLITIILVVAVLYLAQEVLIPLALAVLLTFLLAPLVDRLQRWGLGRVLAVITTTLLAFLIVGIVGWVVVHQAIDLTAKLPEYRENIRGKIASIQVSSGGVLGRARQNIKDISKDVLSTS